MKYYTGPQFFETSHNILVGQGEGSFEDRHRWEDNIKIYLE
jgi:hypothetical protein